MHLRRLLLLSGAWSVFGQYNTLEGVLIDQSATLSTLNAWLQSQSLILQILSNAQGVTLLAPSNDALNQMFGTSLSSELASDPNFLTAFLAYHALDGVYFVSNLSNAKSTSIPTFLNMEAYSNVSGGQVVRTLSQNGSVTLITGNNMQSNLRPYDYNYVGGTVHIIDSVLSIPGNLTDTLMAGGLTAAVGALRRAGAEASINAAADVTVFVPNNDAFNAIGSLVSSMTLEQLTTVLNYHVIQGKVLYSELISGGSETTVEGAGVNFRVQNGALFVNSARVVTSDILVANGVVHIVDGVLNPANTTATPDPNAATQPPAFNGASSATGGVPFTSAVASTTTVSVSTTPTASFSHPSPVRGAAPEKRACMAAAAAFGGVAVLANW